MTSTLLMEATSEDTAARLSGPLNAWTVVEPWPFAQLTPVRAEPSEEQGVCPWEGDPKTRGRLIICSNVPMRIPDPPQGQWEKRGTGGRRVFRRILETRTRERSPFVFLLQLLEPGLDLAPWLSQAVACHLERGGQACSHLSEATFLIPTSSFWGAPWAWRWWQTFVLPEGSAMDPTVN